MPNLRGGQPRPPTSSERLAGRTWHKATGRAFQAWLQRYRSYVFSRAAAEWWARGRQQRSLQWWHAAVARMEAALWRIFYRASAARTLRALRARKRVCSLARAGRTWVYGARLRSFRSWQSTANKLIVLSGAEWHSTSRRKLTALSQLARAAHADYETVEALAAQQVGAVYCVLWADEAV